MKRFTLRRPCARCAVDGHTDVTDGWMVDKNGQQVAYCARAEHYCYTIPKAEQGEDAAPAPTNRRPNITTGQRARIFLRDNGRCLFCGTDEGERHLGHLVSVKDAEAIGLTDDELYSDSNLAVMCRTCNLDLGARSVGLRIMAKVIRRAAQFERDGDDGLPEPWEAS